MRAIVIATGFEPEMDPLNERFPSPMTPFIDRPFIQHVVEYITTNGVEEIDFVLSHLPEKIENFLGDGQRWGSSFRFHLAKNPSTPYGQLRTIKSNHDEPLLLIHADRLLNVDLEEPESAMTEPKLYYYNNSKAENTPQWTGWAWLTRRFIDDIPMTVDFSALETILKAKTSPESIITVLKPLNVCSFEGVLESQKAVLSKKFTELMLTGSEVQDGVWLSRNIMLNPTATITAPVYIGANCRIGAGVKLGPNAIIGDDCVLDGRCTVNDSIVLPGSYVGEALELNDVIIDRNSLINVRLGAAIPIDEDFILGSLSRSQVKPFITSVLSRLTAIWFLLVFSPILLLTVLILKLTRLGPISFKTKAVKLPTGSSPLSWKTFNQYRFSPRTASVKTSSVMDSRAHESPRRDFYLRFLPGLINVVKGDMSFVGVPPRTRSEIDQLPSDWRDLYLSAKAGIITETYIEFGKDPSDDDLFSSEAFYVVSANFKHDLSLIFRYYGRVLGIHKKQL